MAKPETVRMRMPDGVSTLIVDITGSVSLQPTGEQGYLLAEGGGGVFVEDSAVYGGERAVKLTARTDKRVLVDVPDRVMVVVVRAHGKIGIRDARRLSVVDAR